VDRLTWPQVKSLTKLIDQMPPPGILEGKRFYYQYVAKSAADGLGGTGMPVKKGKVRRKSDGA